MNVSGIFYDKVSGAYKASCTHTSPHLPTPQFPRFNKEDEAWKKKECAVRLSKEGVTHVKDYNNVF